MANEGEIPANWHDSRTWTGLYHGRNINRLCIIRTRNVWFWFFIWWLKISLKKLICRHDWHWARAECCICGLTHEQAFDHSFRWPKRLPDAVVTYAD